MTSREDLQKQIAEELANWALAYPIPSWQLADGESAEKLARNWGEGAARYLFNALPWLQEAPGEPDPTSESMKGVRTSLVAVDEVQDVLRSEQAGEYTAIKYTGTNAGELVSFMGDACLSIVGKPLVAHDAAEIWVKEEGDGSLPLSKTLILIPGQYLVRSDLNGTPVFTVMTAMAISHLQARSSS